MPFMWELNFHLFLISHCPPSHGESQQVIILMKDVTLKLLAYFTFGHLYYWLLLLLLLDDRCLCRRSVSTPKQATMQSSQNKKFPWASSTFWRSHLF